MASGSRTPSVAIALLWLLAGLLVVLHATLQYTSFGGSVPRNLLSSHTQARNVRSSTATNALFGSSSGRQQAWGNPFQAAAGSEVQGRGAVIGAATMSALFTLFQALSGAPALAAIAVCALVAGLAAKQGSLKTGEGLNFSGIPSFGYGQASGARSWSTPSVSVNPFRNWNRSQSSSPSYSTSGLNNSWQQSWSSSRITSSPISSLSGTNSWQQSSWSTQSSTVGKWMPGSSNQNTWQKNWFGGK